MAEHMILDRAVIPRRFTLLDGVPPTGLAPDMALPCHDWQRLHAAGDPSLAGVGLILEGDCDIRALRADLADVPFVVLHLPKFSDGRCYTHAYRLRRLWGYTGTILVYGDVLRDQLVYLWRVGINAFYLRQDQDARAALASFSLFTDFYQYGPVVPAAAR